MPLTSHEEEIVHTVSADLRYLQARWDPLSDDEELRRGSTVLRLLLVDNGGAYPRARRLLNLPGEARLLAPDLRAWFGMIDLTKLHVALAGGAEYSPPIARSLPEPQARTGIASHIYGLATPLTPDEQAAWDEAQDELRQSRHGPYRRGYGLAEYLASPSFIVQGQYVSRRAVIKYVANKLGGAHLDGSRKPGASNDFRLLDLAGTLIAPLQKHCVYFELLSIGQALARSQDADRFLAEADRVVGKDRPTWFHS